MAKETLEAAIRWQVKVGNHRPLDITFHGGEPLVPGVSFYQMALPLLRNQLSPRQVRFSVQSNLWLLSDEICELFRQYQVAIGTSLDGPESVNDAQRGNGYFRKTMAGIKRARAYRLSVGCICTFTNQTVEKAEEIFEFFLKEKLGFSIHAALLPLGCSDSFLALSPQDHGQLLVSMLDRYLENTSAIRISTLDAMARSTSAGKGSICTFTECLGQYLAIDPDGWIFPCQRMAGMAAYQLGNVYDSPSMEDLKNSPIWQSLARRQERIAEVCVDCSYLPYCQGGCPYNVLAANHGSLDGDPRDSHCMAYRQAFDAIAARAMKEVFSEQNLNAVANSRQSNYGFLQKGALVEIMRDSPHPTEIASRARRVAAAAALGVCGSPEEARKRLQQAGLITNPEAAAAAEGELNRKSWVKTKASPSAIRTPRSTSWLRRSLK